LAVLHNDRSEPRLLAVTRALSAELLCIGGLADTMDHALTRVDAALASGQALERFARMVAALGGPADFVERAHAHLPVAPVRRAVASPRAGWVRRMATREIGVLVVELGGGRRRTGDAIDHRVGLADVVALGERVAAGGPLAIVHAADEAAAEAACSRLAELIEIADAPPPDAPVLIERLTGEEVPS
ncbi:MAG TPA: thymidine phosphorylase, partial [Burkholderiaceae bacterium]|nr:thymidine phosphorylase [Burkholderiaceae bacterium]